jgi:hypothetical protein
MNPVMKVAFAAVVALGMTTAGGTAVASADPVHTSTPTPRPPNNPTPGPSNKPIDHERAGHDNPGRHDHPAGDWRHDHPEWIHDHLHIHPGWHFYKGQGWWPGAVTPRECRTAGGDPDFRHDECDGGRFDDWLLIY